MTNQNISHMTAAALLSVTLAGCAADPGSAPAATPGPQGTPGSAQGCKADKLEDNALIGKTESEATALLTGCRWRIGERDGEQFMGTMDYWEDRRTLGIANGKVTWVKRG